eukprot:m.178288 g.178288  ORF g.178288 m.178288 type:complete len:57 (+) comp17979_c2_seq3:1230-1400(+)
MLRCWRGACDRAGDVDVVVLCCVCRFKTREGKQKQQLSQISQVYDHRVVRRAAAAS